MGSLDLIDQKERERFFDLFELEMIHAELGAAHDPRGVAPSRVFSNEQL